MEANKQVEIDGKTFTVQLFSAKKGKAVLERSLKVFGSSLAGIISEVDENFAKDQKKVMAAVNKAVLPLLPQLGGPDWDFVLFGLLGTTFNSNMKPLHEDGRVGLWETEFQGSLVTMYKVAIEAWMFNFSDFLAVAKDIDFGVSESAAAKQESTGPTI